MFTSKTHSLIASILALTTLFFCTLIASPKITHAESLLYSITFPTSSIGQYYLEGGAFKTESGGTQCIELRENLYPNKADCTIRQNQYSDSTFIAKQFPNPPYSAFRITNHCSQITKQNYTFVLTQPACSNSLASLGMKLVSGASAGAPIGGSGNTGGAPIGGAGNTGGGSGRLENPLNVSSLPDLLKAILGGVVEIGAILLTVMIVYVGFLFVAAQGNEEKIRSARSALVWTVIGGLILLGATAISEVIQATVGTITS